MIDAYIALGSNLNDPSLQVKNAILALEKLPKSKLINTSNLYVTKPMGPQNQPDYINAVVLLKTEFAAMDLLDQLQAIEINQGRIRDENNQWGPRTLDLDLLLYGNEIITTPRLKIPHPGLTQRQFVLVPLAEIAPDLTLPNGEKLMTYCNFLVGNVKIAAKSDKIG